MQLTILCSIVLVVYATTTGPKTKTIFCPTTGKKIKRLVTVCPSNTDSSIQDSHTSFTPKYQYNLESTTTSVTTKMGAVSADHNEETLALAKKESAEHMHGMKELFDSMRQRSLIVKAYALDDPSAPDGDNVKTVHFVRHGQGFHNLMADIASKEGRKWEQYSLKPENPYIMPEIYDAPLTEKGRQQALKLQSVVEGLENQPELVVLSPNCRALQTGVLVFENLLSFDKKVPFISHEMAREETGVHICDKRRPKSRQAKEFPQVDFSLLETEEDVIFRPEQRDSKAEVGERIYKFMEWLSQRPEKHVGVASHSGWLLTVFNGVCDSQDEKLKEWFQTGEMRSVKLEFIDKK